MECSAAQSVAFPGDEHEIGLAGQAYSRRSGARGLFFREGRWRLVVRHVSFDVEKRESVAVVGESGSGKSISSMSIMGLIPPSVGRVSGSEVLDGRQLLGRPESELKKIRGVRYGHDHSGADDEPQSSLVDRIPGMRSPGDASVAAVSRASFRIRSRASIQGFRLADRSRSRSSRTARIRRVRFQTAYRNCWRRSAWKPTCPRAIRTNSLEASDSAFVSQVRSPFGQKSLLRTKPSRA